MAYLHNDREQFKDAIYLAYDQIAESDWFKE